ncbi:MAG: GNAT family N-acetyltransferase [Thermoanaerobaculia bacterium]
MRLRVLREEDLPVLDRCAEGVFDDPIDRRAAAEFLADRRHHLVVALDGEAVVGFASAVHYAHPDEARPELWINEVGVAPTHRGKGLGRALMDAMLGLGRELECEEAWVLTERSNGAAMGLYAAAGGRRSSRDVVMFSFDLAQGAG